jgi:Protein of unknown function (DUF2934)
MITVKARQTMLRRLAQQLNRQTWISEAAYYLAEKRGLIPGQESIDWQQAEISYYEVLIAAYNNILQEDGQMTVASVRQLVELIGIEDADKLHTEAELVHAVQIAVKHRPCFRTKANGECQEIDCVWRSECMKLTAAWHVGVDIKEVNNVNQAAFIY